MTNITFKQLRYFDALSRHGHFGHAAETCAISQPALSAQIKELETQLGARLFERGTRHVRLTGFGEVFGERVRSILRSVDELGDLARAAHSALVGRLRLGIIPTIAPYLLPPIISDLARTYPDLDLQIRETLTQNLLSDLADGHLDMAIVALPTSEASLAEVPLFEEEFVLVRPVADGDKPVPSKDMLRDMKLLLLEEGHCFRDQALSFCDMSTSRPRELMDGSTLSTLVQMVSAGIGVTLIPEIAIDVETRAAEVSVDRFAQPPPCRTVGLVYRSANPLAGQLQDIAGIIRKSALVARGQKF